MSALRPEGPQELGAPSGKESAGCAMLMGCGLFLLLGVLVMSI